MSSSLERLSSGYKINKAADDSAGLAITNKMRTQIRALDQSSRNASDGQSIIETAEGAMSEVENILQRIRELAVQAANDTYSLDDRKAIQSEADEMMDEIDRISQTTEFNGKALLDGSVARTISSNKAGVTAMSASMSVDAGTYKINVVQAAKKAEATLNYTIPATADQDYSIRINDVSIKITSTDTDDSISKKVVDACDAMNIDVIGSGQGMRLQTNTSGSAQKIEIQYPTDKEPTVYKGSDAQITFGDGFEDSAAYTADGDLVNIVDNNGFKIQLEIGENAAGEVTLETFDAGYMTIQIGANEGQTLNMNFAEVSCLNLGLKDSSGVDKINYCTQDGATNAISKLDEAIQAVSSARSTLGAYQNRLESTTSSLDLTSQNITEAMSRISDTDMADEMTEYTQRDVLSQAATSMLAQANNRPQQIMSLLQS